MTKAAELRAYADEELGRRLEEASQELFNLRFQVVTGQLDNVSRIPQLRREVARVRTIQRQRELQGGSRPVGANRRAKEAK